MSLLKYIPIRLNKYTGSFLALGLTLWDTKGMFFSGIPIGLIVITILFFYWLKTIISGKSTIAFSNIDFTPGILFLIVIQGILFLSGLFYEPYDLLHADTTTRASSLIHAIAAMFFIGTAYLLYRYRADKDLNYTLSGLIALAIILQLLSVFCSVVTGIDVTVMLQKACDYLLHLKDPYAGSYQDIFNGYYAKYYGTISYMIYWPANLYIGTIFYFFFGDYRYAFVFISLMLILFMYKYRHKTGLDTTEVLLLILLWVSNPVLIYTINRGWIDAFATLPYFLCIYYLSVRKLHLSAIFLGLVLAVKLYYIWLVPFIFIYLISHFGLKRAIAFAAISGAIFSLTILPFLIINAPQFYTSTIAVYSGMKLTRPDSLSWVSYLTRLHLELAAAGTYFSIIAIVMLCILFMLRKKTISLLLEYSAMALFIFFLFARQAFCNYYLNIFFLYFLCMYFKNKQDQRDTAIPVPAGDPVT
jgi:uncharacterized membrane protein